jgi:hypothetical protein
MSRIADFLDRLMRRKVPASVFVTMNPQMQAVRIAVRENGRQSFEDYIREQVAACSRSSVVPDHTLLHLTFPDSKAIPSRRSTTNEYFYGKLAPAFIRQDIHPEPAVSLRDAAFALSKGLSPLSPAGRREQLMRDSEYRRFTMHCARTAPDDAPLYRAVTSSQGTYLFSDTPKGRRAMYCYMQYMTDRFFGMRTDADTLKIYELKHLPPRIAAMADKCIDKFVKSDLKSEYPGLERSRYSFTEEVDSDIGTFGRHMFGSIFHIAVLRGLREVRCREPDTGIVRQSRSRNAVVYRGKRVRRICSRRRVASFQTSGVLLRGGVETPGLRPGAYGKPAIDARLRVRCLAAAGP